MSGYIFGFNAPRPLATAIGLLGDHWAFRLLNAFADSNDPTQPIPGKRGFEMLASSIGPSKKELAFSAKVEIENGTSEGDLLTYPASIRNRSYGSTFFQRLRIYREGLFMDDWEKSLETLWELSQIDLEREGSSSPSRRRRSSNKVGVFDLGPPGTFGSPVTILWGKGDVAINDKLALEGISDYFGVKGSQLVNLADCGHWVPLQKPGADVWAETLLWSLDGEKGTLKDRLEKYPTATVAIES